MSNINDLLATINKYGGLASSNRFAVHITPPSHLLSEARDLIFLCDTVNIPGITFSTDSFKHKGYGLSEVRPNGASFDDVTCTFFIDNAGLSIGFFQKWLQSIHSFDPNHVRENVQGMSLESFNYPDDYYGTVEIYYRDSANGDFMIYTMSQCYPVNMGSTTLGWEQNDTIARFPVTFTYRAYSTNVTSAVDTTSNQTIDTNSVEGRINAALNNDVTPEEERFIDL